MGVLRWGLHAGSHCECSSTQEHDSVRSIRQLVRVRMSMSRCPNPCVSVCVCVYVCVCAFVCSYRSPCSSSVWLSRTARRAHIRLCMTCACVCVCVCVCVLSAQHGVHWPGYDMFVPYEALARTTGMLIPMCVCVCVFVCVCFTTRLAASQHPHTRQGVGAVA